MFPLSNELSWAKFSATHNANGCPFPARGCINIGQISRSGMPGLFDDFRREIRHLPCLLRCNLAEPLIEYPARDDGVTGASSSRHRQGLLAGEDETSE
jgi:hypothetical protein